MPDEPAPLPSSEQSTLDQASASAAHAIGRYRLLQRIGEGGMGEVWLAEQTEPVRRQVALKVIKAGMDSARVIARFEAERQALALMDHPAIATVFDGGTTPQGRPYFAMEYIKGEPITIYCDRHRLTTHRRLELFTQVCDGVQHAHQKGIIHRDLKPSNVLVAIQDDRPVPRIIDFGVAKATAQQLTERSLFTELGVLIGTPEYMSPEQAEMGALDIDTRSDIYALGVLLYELLTGTLPFDRKDLRQASLVEIQRIIREREPPRPSTRIKQLGPASTETAKSHGAEARRLANELRGDLAWIAMRSLEKDRTRRYQTANALAADVRRHLANEPVSAGPPSAVYRAGKFVRRHRFGVGAAATLVVLLVAFGVTMFAQARRIARERDRANQEAQAASQVSDFLVSVFREPDPSEAKGRSVTAREVLDRGAARLEKELASQPQIQARLMRTIADVYESLGLSAEARPLYEKAYQVRRQALGADHPETLKSLGDLSNMFESAGNHAESERYARESVDAHRRVFGRDAPETLEQTQNLAGALVMQDKLAEAEALFREVLGSYRRQRGDGHPTTLIILGNLGQVLYREGKLADAEPYLKEALDRRLSTLGRDHPDTLWTWRAMGALRRKQGRLAEAESYYREALEGRRRILPAGHVRIATTALDLGLVLNELERYQEAESVLREALAILPADADSVATAQLALGHALVRQRQFPQAEPLLLQGYGRLAASQAPQEDDKHRALEDLTSLYDGWGKPEKAREWRAKLEAQ